MAAFWNTAKKIIGLEEEETVEEASERTEKKNEEHGLLKFRPLRRSNDNEDKDGWHIAVYEPKVYEDSLPISTNLREGNPVVVNLKHLDPNEGTRLIDFVCGTAYAIDGHMIRIGESIFLFTPNTIRIADHTEKANIEQSTETGEHSFFNRR